MSKLTYQVRRIPNSCAIVQVTLRDGRVVSVEKLREQHDPVPTPKKDRYGTYDEIRCSRCGKLLLGSFI